MDLLLDYRKDRNNGISTIADIIEQQGISWGQPFMTDRFLAAPLTVNKENYWKIFCYRYNTDVDNWVFHQVFDMPSLCDGTYVRCAISSNTTSPTLAVLNNVTHQVHLYRLDEFEQWQINQTINIPYSPGTNLFSERIAADGDYVVISDWNKNYGASTGEVNIYMWQSATNSHVLVETFGNPTANSIRYGEGLDIQAEVGLATIFVGAPLFDGLSGDDDGRVYIYTGAADVWSLLTTLDGELSVNGYFGWFLSAYIYGATARLLIGARGYTDPFGYVGQGKAYFYHRSGGVWTLNTAITAPSAPIDYRGTDYQFGSVVSIWGDQACVVAGDELANQGAIYCHKYNGANWVIDTKSDGVSDARFTRTGTTSYGLFANQTPQTVFTMIQMSDGLFLSRRPTGWIEFTFMYHDNLYLKQTVDQSFYHLASGNQTIIFKLETPIVGKYKVTLQIANALETIGPQNDKIYFVENGDYKVADLTHGNYTGGTLASHVQSRMNSISTWPGNYYIEYNALSNKFVVTATYPFTFGSNDPNSLVDSCQNKTMGFYDNHNSIVHILYASDIEASLTPPERIGVNILESFAIIPIRNNCIFAELGMMANLDQDPASLTYNHYVILDADDQVVNFPKKVSQLSFVFPCIDGGAFLNINTNDLQARLRLSE